MNTKTFIWSTVVVIAGILVYNLVVSPLLAKTGL